MKRTSIWIITIALFFFFIMPISVISGPFDQLKNLNINPRAIMKPKATAPVFQFANFKLNPDSNDASRVWTVDIKISQSISTNAYVVKTVFQNKQGVPLFSGEDINLPVGNAGKTYHLTRPFQKEPTASRIIFQVFNQAEGRIVDSKTYPLPAASLIPIQHDTVSGKPAGAQRVPESSRTKIDTDLNAALAVDPDKREIQIQNKSSFPVTINELSARARFLAGIDQEIKVDCRSKKTIQPGQNVICYFDQVANCPTLARIDIDAKLNGSSYHEEVKFDIPIKRITAEPVISLEKKQKISQYDAPGGTAKIIIRGSYVRLDSLVTIKALASVDSDRFPVVFTGIQKDDGIHAEITIRGTDAIKKPEKFCFNLMEITTCDQLRCGGVGVLLYRNDYTYYMYSDVNLFLLRKECK